MLSTLVLTLSLSLFAAENAPKGYSTEAEPLVADVKPKEIQNVGITEKLGQVIDLNMTFKDETGQTVKLSQYIDGKKPVIISPIYYNCPRLCNYHLNGLTDGLKVFLELNIGLNALFYQFHRETQHQREKTIQFFDLFPHLLMLPLAH